MMMMMMMLQMVSVQSGDVLATWGRQLNTWTPTAIAATRDQRLLVSNVHPQATTRLTLFTPDGREVTLLHFIYIFIHHRW